VGSIIGATPQVVVVVSVSHQTFDRLGSQYAPEVSGYMDRRRSTFVPSADDLAAVAESLPEQRSQAIRDALIVAFGGALTLFLVQVRAPAHAEHGFRLKLNADSGGS
jgi:hypothetical protein